MGYAKYFEDDEEISIDRKFERIVFKENVSLPIQTYYDCYYCDKSFESFELRNKHIKDHHSTVGPLLLINGKICSEEYYVDIINSAKIIFLGYTDLTIEIDKININHNNVDIDIVQFLSKEKDNYNIKIGTKTYFIKKYKLENWEKSKCDEIIENWEKLLENNISLEYNDVTLNLNQIEKKYIDGFYEYYIACKAGIDKINKQKRYNTAFTLLSSFDKLSGRANILLKVIAFRFNWIERLTNLSYGQSNGLFNPIVDFFNGINSDYKLKINNEEAINKIYIEDELEVCIDAIYSFQNKDWLKVDEFIEYWNDYQLQNIENINLKDKILFYKIRRYHILENYAKIEYYFKTLKSPFLKNKAEAYRIKNKLN